MPSSALMANLRDRGANLRALMVEVGGDWRGCFPRESVPDVRTAAPHGDETGRWEPVKSRSRRSPVPPALPPCFNARPAAPLWQRNRCFRCHSKRHRAWECRDPIRCNNCWRSGHREKDCKQEKILRDASGCRICQPPALRQATAPPQAPPATRAAPPSSPPVHPAAHPDPAAPAVMQRHGALESQPEEDWVVIAVIPQMQQEALLLSSNGVVAWLDGLVEGVSTGLVQRAVASACGALFNDVNVVAILPDPVQELTPRPSPPANRRKTLVVGFTVRQSSIRIQGAHRGAPIAKMAERNLLRKLGIVDDDDDVTPEAIDDFVQLFRTHLPPDAIAALRSMFKFDSEHAIAVEEALLRYGGPRALDQEMQEDADQA